LSDGTDFSPEKISQNLTECDHKSCHFRGNYFLPAGLFPEYPGFSEKTKEFLAGGHFRNLLQ